MKKMRNRLAKSKLYEMMADKDREEAKKTVVWVIGIVAALIVVVGIAYAVYRYFAMDYMKDFSDDFEDDFEDDYFEDDEF